MHFIEERAYLAGCQRKSARRKGTRIILAKVRGAPASRMVGDALLRDPAVQSRRMQTSLLFMRTHALRPRIVSEGSSLCGPAREQATCLFYQSARQGSVGILPAPRAALRNIPAESNYPRRWLLFHANSRVAATRQENRQDAYSTLQQGSVGILPAPRCGSKPHSGF
jgi:hypothetical protein